MFYLVTYFSYCSYQIQLKGYQNSLQTLIMLNCKYRPVDLKQAKIKLESERYLLDFIKKSLNILRHSENCELSFFAIKHPLI